MFCQKVSSFVTLYHMKITILLLLILLGTASCTSEYEERLEQGRNLKNRLELVEGTSNYITSSQLLVEINEIRNEINLLAKVSGNEELFLKQLFMN